jgi:hypothetical protein
MGAGDGGREAGEEGNADGKHKVSLGRQLHCRPCCPRYAGRLYNCRPNASLVFDSEFLEFR